MKPIRTTILGTIICTAQAFGAVVAIDSLPGLPNSVSAATVAVNPFPLWAASPNGTAQWISWGDTGWFGSDFQPYMGSTPAMSVYHTFNALAAGTLSLSVWADDTAEVFLDGVSLYAPAFTQSICSGQPIGCLPPHVGIISTPFSAGLHTVQFDVFQVGGGTDTGSNPFGLLYAASARWLDPPQDNPQNPVPEPATYAMVGLGLLAVGVYGRRKRA